MRKEAKQELMRSIQNAIHEIQDARHIHYKEADYQNNYDDYAALKETAYVLTRIGERVAKS